MRLAKSKLIHVLILALVLMLSFGAISAFADNEPAEENVLLVSTEAPAEDVEQVPEEEAAEEEEYQSRFFGTWLALIPPVIAIGLALITKEVYSSLFLGILSGIILYRTLPRKALNSFQVQLAKRDYDSALRSMNNFDEEMISMPISDIEKTLNSALSDSIDHLNELLQQHLVPPSCKRYGNLCTSPDVFHCDDRVLHQNRQYTRR